jgi:hypothetical protein
MKRIIMFLAVAVAVTACNSNATNNKGGANTYTFRDSVKIIKDSLRLDSFQRAENERKAEVQRQEEIAAAKAEARASASRPQHVTVVNQQPAAAEPAQKKGWSSAAKGAVIGAGAGAVTGILVDKKDGRGAAIGGVVGAGTGYIIGRQKDKKTGRAD